MTRRVTVSAACASARVSDRWGLVRTLADAIHEATARFVYPNGWRPAAPDFHTKESPDADRDE